MPRAATRRELLEMQWHVDTKCLGGLDIDDEFEFCGLLDRQVGGLFALENPTGVAAGQTMRILQTGSVAHQASSRRMLAEWVDSGHRMAGSQRGKLFAPTKEK